MPDLLNIEFSYLPVINFAMQQNGTSFIKELVIENKSGRPLHEVLVKLTTQPDFGQSDPYVIETIAANEILRIDVLKFNLSSLYFAGLTERMKGRLTLEVSDNKETLFRKDYPVDILAYDQWGGLLVLPELLSAFITPNHPAIATIIRQAASILEQWTGSPSFDEYQSRNPDRVRKQMAAIYAAITAQDIIYSSVPASFDEYGQRIRLVDTIMAQKLATCLDMALLYTSCLESVGIHPLIVITEGHAFAGGWLIPETFSNTIIDDAAYITKRTADGINEIALVETTCMNMGNGSNFDTAAKIAEEKTSNQLGFVMAIDVKRSRMAGIRPVPQRVLNGLEWVIVEEEPVQAAAHHAPQSISRYDLSGIDETIVVTKQLLWERKLLDLSLRNNLLNIRITKNTLQLISADLHLLEDSLAGGSEFQVLSRPADLESYSPQFGLYPSPSPSDTVSELIKNELPRNKLRTYLSDKDLTQSLTYLYRSSRTSMEENGANTLYIALGLLEWYETPVSERPRYAPLLLLPVEIVRKSASKGYIIRSREEETLLNITLLEMLRQNFGITIKGLDPLPTDESGVNVKLIYSIIRSSIKNQRKWDVKEQAILGIFSFNKFIMWNDIHNNARKLSENKVVSSLMNGMIEWDTETDTADAALLDKELSPVDIVLPIGADSSQLEAIYESTKGKTFILHGPPGTGKSQTITNIIANALYNGKRVLFVAEKMAALSVVQNRLDALGLSPFCLELYSNKAKKSSVLSQLKEASEVVKLKSPENFRQEADKLFQQRQQINVYIEALHKQYPIGVSLYEAITSYLANKQTIEIGIPQPLIENLSKERLEEWKDALASLVSMSNAVGHPYHHPLTGVNVPDYSSSIKEQAAVLLKNTLIVLSEIEKSQSVFAELLGTPTYSYNKEQTDLLSFITATLLEIPELTRSLITMPRLDEALGEYREVIPHGQNRDSLKENITDLFTEQILLIPNAIQLLAEWKSCSEKWFLPRWLGHRSIKKQLKIFSKQGKIDTDIIPLTLDRIINFQTEERYLNQHANELPLLFGRYGRKGLEDWESIGKIIDDASAINTSILNYTRDIAKASSVKENMGKLLTEGVGSFKTIYGNKLNKINNLLAHLSSLEQQLTVELGIDMKPVYSDSPDWINLAGMQLNDWLSNLDKLKDWFQWLTVYRRMEVLGIGFVADTYKKENIKTDAIKDIFNKSLDKSIIIYILSKEPQLELFNGKLFDDVIARYREMTAQFEMLTRKEIYAKLASNIPDFTREAAQNSEVGILQRNIRNNGRATPIRRLFDQIPVLLPRICPCMLMSPISVAQYIDPEAEKFDLVIFDEASQMPTSEAVGAIARGTNVVIVGDPKQMPPTSFFSTNNVDEDYIEMEDLESILDDCLALSVPSKYLLWHYRSKHESLIAFSNSEYYDNKLLTFPSPDNIESKVKLIPVEGFYDKGKSRQNRKEAQAVVNEIARRLRDPQLRQYSIGVVTFSIVQQSLIDDILSDLFVHNPDLEKWALDCAEPVFVKNLENVQGDERDIILFSVGYGSDKAGKVSMNFGPLNRLGGERRLNVAVSRARYEMIIFSNLRSEQIDLNRTSAVGVAGLKRFLEYAEKGERIYVNNTISTSENSIENLIAQAIGNMGYTVHTHIGSSGYRIDIGIVDKNNPSEYILGILCDGDNYRRTKTIRDREMVQFNVLKALGWNFIRVWTMDWWENKEAVMEQIFKAIKEAEENIHIPVQKTDLRPDKQSEQGEIIGIDTPIGNKTASYKPALLKSVNQPTEAFTYSNNETIIAKQIKEIIKSEAPVSQSLLYKRILSAWNITRAGQRIDNHLSSLLKQSPFYSNESEGFTFWWKDEDQYKQYDLYRTGSGRDATDLPPEEVANAIREIMINEISLPATDLNRIAAQTFGFARGGVNIDAAIHRGLRVAIERGFVRFDSGKVIIL